MNIIFKYIDSPNPQVIETVRFLWWVTKYSYTKFIINGNSYWVEDNTGVFSISSEWDARIDLCLITEKVRLEYEELKKELKKSRS